MHCIVLITRLGHDSGLIVFKLERERPAHQVYQNQLFYVKNKIVHVHDFASGADQELLSVRQLGSQYTNPRTLSYNPAERAVLISSVGHILFLQLTCQLTHVFY